ncbi:MAG: rhodanese-like domain-containing protein [Bacteroidales bacterium]|nr:rhodanese-like domain-containing protein [Bacteroidales bacterium]
MKKIIQISLLALAVLFSSCSEKEMKVYESSSDMVKDAQSCVETITAEDLKSAVENEEKLYIIDCREENEYDSACIKGAVNVPRGLAEFTISNAAPERRSKLVVYCSNGDRSSLLASVLPKMKFSNVVVLEGGFENWKQQFPDLVELEPKSAQHETKVAGPPSGGCGG